MKCNHMFKNKRQFNTKSFLRLVLWVFNIDNNGDAAAAVVVNVDDYDDEIAPRAMFPLNAILVLGTEQHIT